MINLEEYSKEDLILAIKQFYLSEEIIRNLIIIKYNRITSEAKELGAKATNYLNENNFKLATEYFDKSEKLYIKASKFLERTKS